MAQKSRSELQGLFQTGAKPSQQDFADFIESTLNIKDDGIEKPSGADTPLKITATSQGLDEKLVDFYAGEAKTWSINQKSGDKLGFNISTSDGSSKLFIDSGNGNVGLSIDRPSAKLHIQQTGNQDALRIDDELNDTTPFLINKDGNVGIGTANPENYKLNVQGNQYISGDLKVNRIIELKQIASQEITIKDDLNNSINLSQEGITIDSSTRIKLTVQGSSIEIDSNKITINTSAGRGVSINGSDF